ncbi:family 78 glycoside hydrolase catalytic domain [Niabella yanshanensis]|uniref:alpha-L-rhamnosidase n=1 Tax=Niabella yanshanensis TaxID=577386 RepID=A0ABZ0W6M0_9BACT|nr:alpha-L-rhamnosidase [Niabella yanshanensis]WQD38933.1 family 78 glycoside hydrolase catalytic domain [Niabella yanshanensis]
MKRTINMLFAFLLCSPVWALSDIKPVYLRCNYKVNPFIDTKIPMLSWELVSNQNNQVQTAYQVMVASSLALLNNETPDIWNSGKTEGNQTNQVAYNGKPLFSAGIYYWKVRSWDKDRNAGPWSIVASWETGLFNKLEWKADWIGFELDSLNTNKDYHLPPAPYLRREVRLKTGIKRARLYVTSLGLNEFYVNGTRIGSDYFLPGWTDYNKRLYYQVYDVSKNIKAGDNVLGAVLSPGWYAGYVGYALLVGSPQVRGFYGNTPLLRASVWVEYHNGEREIIATDGSWKASDGALRETDILNGETYDARREVKGWSQTGFNMLDWKPVTIYADKADRELQVYPGNPVAIFDTLTAKKITKARNGRYIVDFGQNFSGIIRLNVKGKTGDSIIIRYGEMLHPDGRLMTENLRRARAIDTYIIKGDENMETWSPQFTYHGFQFVEIAGLKYQPTIETIKGLVLTSSTPGAGTMETDNAMINQLYKNIVWTQRSNYFDIPTDCPQRDERLGWTGDAQVYTRSAIYNNDISAFFLKWLQDLNDAQFPNGAYPIYAPMPLTVNGLSAIRSTDSYSPGWMEAGIICAYEMYQAYGDTGIIKKYWPGMKRFMSFLDQKAGGDHLFKERAFEEISPKGGFGDWLSVGKKTSPDLLASIYYFYCSKLMEEMAAAIGADKDKQQLQQNAQRIRAAFVKHYTDGAGNFKVNPEIYGDVTGYVEYSKEKGFHGHTQTAYANAIYMGLLPADFIKIAGNSLAGLLNENDWKLATGFLGVKPLLPALSLTGHTGLAYHLLLSKEYPSWGFEVINGATTIWERWNSYIKEKGFENNAGMNSFNHYSFGSVNEWMFEYMAGIKPAAAGFKKIIIRPEIADSSINYVKASYHSINGKIESSWKKVNGKLIMDIIIPVNTKAKVLIPASSVGSVRVKGKNDIMLKSSDVSNRVEADLGSGKYQFEVTGFATPE